MVTGCGTAYAVVHENVWTHGLPATIVYDYPEFVLVLDAERDDDETHADKYKIVCLTASSTPSRARPRHRPRERKRKRAPHQ